ncbi:hypothetical protein [Streptomyces sp. NPDC001380]|uniref:hypothetical protein n=1 Tax=Streptomyces sp. NPDC001380 TaxID=3364566 RepID=UPI0036C6F7FB
MSRTLDLEAWSALGAPLLRDPRAFVADLHQRHLPPPGTVVVGVLDALHRLVGSASFTPRPSSGDGWQHRNALLAHLRRIVPHDLRRTAPSRTAVLMLCREGDGGWTPQDGAWMWGLRDAAGLHGLRCGSVITLTRQGWQVLGDGRRGRTPHAGSWAYGGPPAVPGLTVHDGLAGYDGPVPDGLTGHDGPEWAHGPAGPVRRTAAR